ncbi:hypothetical protein ABZU25_10115 [Micromonospora sp. NPDC005215]|uniref:hypothetical protein n=1 Tax=Micromonospora sp. NPDC005215 TaxID=3157024 RepID=UPI0033AACEBC
MDVGGAFTGFATAIATIFGLSRASRLRHAIDGNVKLFSEMKTHEELSAAGTKLAELIDLQVRRLLEIGDGSVKKERDPGGGFVGILFTALFALPIYWLARIDHWWAVLLLVADVLFVLVLLGATISAYRSPRRRKPEDDTA